MGVIFDPILGQLRTKDASGSASPLTTKGDIYTYSTTNDRLPVGVNGTVLSADSTQATGLKWIASGGTGTVTSVSVTTANGVSGTVATATTTPAISLTLGAITPTSVNSVVLSGSTTPTLAVTGTSSISGSNTGDQTIILTGAVTGTGTGSFATTIATPGTLTVSSTNSTATAHTHAITSSSAPGAAASLLATDASGIIGSTGTRIVKGWFTDLTVTNAIAGSITGNAATVTGLSVTGGKTLTVSNSITLAGTDATVMTFPTASDTVAGLAAVQTITGAWTYNDGKLILAGATSGTTVVKANATAGSTTVTFPATTGIVALTSSSITGSAATLTTSRNINGIGFNGSADISVPSLTFSVVTASATAAINTGYATNSASLITMTLPATAAVGSMIELTGMGVGGWKIAQPASVLVHFGFDTTTTGITGSLASTGQYDSIRIVCIVANTTWNVLSSVGSITVV